MELIILLLLLTMEKYLSLNNLQVYSWGNNDNGELGIGSFESKETPQLIELFQMCINKIKIVSSGNNHNCAISETGQV